MNRMNILTNNTPNKNDDAFNGIVVFLGGRAEDRQCASRYAISCTL